jgi:hypothetical protein
MMSKISKYISVVVMVLGMISSAYAESNVPTPTNMPKAKKTTVNFEDQLIEGQASKPDLMYLLQKKKFNYKKLIRLRENFLPAKKAKEK